MRQFKTDGVLFDLDGTLWDSGDGVVEAIPDGGENGVGPYLYA